MAVEFYDATNAIVSRLNTAWQANAAAAVGSSAVPELVHTWVDRSGYGDIERPDNLPWGRVSVRHNDANPRSIGKRYIAERTGICWVECRVFFEDGTAGPKALKLAEIAHSAYEGARIDKIWFPRVVLREVGKENGRWQRVDVLAYFKWTAHVTVVTA